MLRPRLETVSLRYGCHDAEWTLPAHDRPVVIVGSNGSGKSTLVDGLVRTLFGFDRRRGEDSAEFEARRPWSHEGVWGRVVLARNGDRFEVRRDFETGRVRVFDPDQGVEHFSGDGNPAARNQEARHYRQILTDLLGLRDLDAYRQTLLIRQGDLPHAALGDHLLRVAEGGHARVEAARRQIAQSHRVVTRRPLHPGAAAAINPRELEKLDEEIAAATARLEAAREAAERRTPLALDRERVAERMGALDHEISLLEDALSALARTDAAELTRRELRRRINDAHDAGRQLRTALDELNAARAVHRDALRGGPFPADTPERMARAEVRWRDMDELRRPPMPWLRPALLGGLAAAGGLFLADYPFPAAIIAGIAILAAAGWGALWTGARRRRRAAALEVAALLDGVPGADSLGPATRTRALALHGAQEEAARRLDEARNDLADALRRARAVLREIEDDHEATRYEGAGPAAAVATESDPEDGAEEAAEGSAGLRALSSLRRLGDAAESARERLAAGRLELDRIGDLSLALPDDVPPTEEAVADALRRRRAERASVQESLRDASQQLLERGTPSESVDALESHLASLEPRREALARKAQALEDAHALILDAYDAFRDHDQDRLTERVSHHIARLGAGRFQGVHVEGSLDEAHVRLDGRLVPMATPPLSFGEFHAVQLGVRLGAADFLAGMGIHPPLIIDEPFAHLDDERATAVWHLLEDVAVQRQVLITTQDTRLLEHLGVAADIALSP